MTFGVPVLAPRPGDFAFACNRCGHCCTNRSGFVWVREDEVEQLARALNLTAAAFACRYLRRVGERLSLVEEGGRCALLTADNACSAYDARPEHCRTFPFWDSIVAGGSALEAARESCPGIFEAPQRAERQRAYAALRRFYEEADEAVARLKPRCQLSGNCCDFPRYGHRLFATLLEVDFAAEEGEGGGVALEPDWCEFYRNRRCQARATRPLACRTFYCDAAAREGLESLHESLLARLRGLTRELGYPQGYGDFVELLPARRRALALLDGARGEVPNS